MSNVIFKRKKTFINFDRQPPFHILFSFIPCARLGQTNLSCASSLVGGMNHECIFKKDNRCLRVLFWTWQWDRTKALA